MIDHESGLQLCPVALLFTGYLPIQRLSLLLLLFLIINMIYTAWGGAKILPRFLAVLRSTGTGQASTNNLRIILLEHLGSRPWLPSFASCLEELHEVSELQLFSKETLIECICSCSYLPAVMLGVMVAVTPKRKSAVVRMDLPYYQIFCAAFYPLLRFHYGLFFLFLDFLWE